MKTGMAKMALGGTLDRLRSILVAKFSDENISCLALSVIELPAAVAECHTKGKGAVNVGNMRILLLPAAPSPVLSE